MKDTIQNEATSELSYDAAVKELEEIVRELQRSDCSVDKLSEYASRSVILLRICKDKLGEIDEEVEKLMKKI